MNILNTIVSRKKEEVSQRKSNISETMLVKSPAFEKTCYSFSGFIRDIELSGIIAEFKRKSPSKPSINLSADVVKVTTEYTEAGASALSVLTDIDFFGGKDADLQQAVEVNKIPVLRKDFIVDPYQIIEAKSLGADAVLLIAEILSKNEIDELSKIAIECGLEVLMEIHTEDQIKKYHDRIRNIGVNNRNLKTFKTDIQSSVNIFNQLPKDAIKISESGIDNPETVWKLKKTGYNGFLIGETFMRTNDPGNACSKFIESLKSMS